MTIDCHTHIASARVIPAPFVKGMSDNIYANAVVMQENIKAENINMLLGRLMSFDEDCDKLLAEMDKAGIEKSVLLIVDFGITFPDEAEDLETLYVLHKRILDRYPGRFEVFAGIDPRRKTGGLELFEKSVRDWGFKGLKLYPPCGYSPSDERLYPYYEICAAYGIPVLLHTGPTSPSMSFAFSAPELINDAAHQFPTVNFILAHAAFMMHEQAAILAEYRPNIYLDVSGFTNALRMERFETILSEHKKRGIIHKILFGTDWPIHKLSGSQQTLVELFRNAAGNILNAQEMKLVMGENFNRLLKM